jgi:hypothetical protein
LGANTARMGTLWGYLGIVWFVCRSDLGSFPEGTHHHDG